MQHDKEMANKGNDENNQSNKGTDRVGSRNG